MNEDTTGCLIGFDVTPFIKAAEILLAADETIRALDLLNNLPAYQRDYPPPEVIKLRREIQKHIATANFYSTSANYELLAPDDSSYHMDKSLRGMMLIREIGNLNKDGLLTHLVDMAPGESWTPQMLGYKDLKFSYWPLYVNHPSHEHYKSRYEKFLREKPEPGQPVIFFAGEIIEHLWNTDEIRFCMERDVGLADVVHISTPNRTFDVNNRDWRSKGDLGHLQAFTPTEFSTIVSKMLPEYDCLTYQSQILHARCVLKTSKFSTITGVKDLLADLA